MSDSNKQSFWTGTGKVIFQSAISAIVFNAFFVVILFSTKTVEPSTDTYIGLIAGFIAISVAIVIGYQIYNAIQIKDEIVAQNNRIDSFNSKIESMNTNIENVKGNSNINTQKIINLENITNKYISKIEKEEIDNAYFDTWQTQLNIYLGDESENADFRFSLYLSMIIELAQSNLNSSQFSRYFAELLKLRFLLIETLKEFVSSKEYNETSRKEKIHKINIINNLIQSKRNYSELTVFINNIHQYIITMDDNYLSQIKQMNSIN